MPSLRAFIATSSALGLIVWAVRALPADEPASQTFVAKGVKIHYLIEGKGELVVLIHGLYFSASTNWKVTGVVADLARDHWQVVEIPGAGHLNCILQKEFREKIWAWVRKNSE